MAFAGAILAEWVHDPKDARYWDEDDLLAEQRRQLDVCHGCRLCWNMCPAFPALFDLTDSLDGDFTRIGPVELEPVESLCYQCKLCWVVCPYTDPHDYRLDIPTLFMRSKFVRARRDGVKLSDKLLADTDRLGRVSSALAPVSNIVNRAGLSRRVIELFADVHRDAPLPEFYRQTFEAWFRKTHGQSMQPSANPSRRVAFFVSCTVNYNAPEIGRACVEVLRHNNVEVVLPDQRCCGMPMVEAGMLDGFNNKMAFNLASLASLIRDGYDVVTPGPTCAYVLRNEYPEMSEDSETSKLVAGHTFEMGHYLTGMARDGVLNRNFSAGLGKVAFHASCHTRAQAVGIQSARLLRIIPDTEVSIIEQCSGHDGSWGIRKNNREMSLGIGKPLFEKTQALDADVVVSDCPLAGVQIEEGIGIKSVHSMQAMAKAYGLD